MTTFRRTREQTEQTVMVQLLSEIERNPSFTQRSLARGLGIALGLMNHYLKHCITKGWIRASQISPRRITYFLTPEGFLEKGHMVKDYLARSLTFFRDAKFQCEGIFRKCKEQGWTQIGVMGDGDLQEIALLVAQGTGIQVIPLASDDSLDNYDAILITDISTPQDSYNVLKNKVDPNRILILDLLHISRSAP